jgi:hypothetical protein
MLEFSTLLVKYAHPTFSLVLPPSFSLLYVFIQCVTGGGGEGEGDWVILRVYTGVTHCVFG